MLADATQVRLILALRDGEMSVNELAETVGKPQSAVSQHLAKMRMARMVSTGQEGARVYYRLANEHARQLVVDAIFQTQHSLGGPLPTTDRQVFGGSERAREALLQRLQRGRGHHTVSQMRDEVTDPVRPRPSGGICDPKDCHWPVAADQRSDRRSQ
jgi:DNA-binding transcriptional ArsR family regulator